MTPRHANGEPQLMGEILKDAKEICSSDFFLIAYSFIHEVNSIIGKII